MYPGMVLSEIGQRPVNIRGYLEKFFFLESPCVNDLSILDPLPEHQGSKKSEGALSINCL